MKSIKINKLEIMMILSIVLTSSVIALGGWTMVRPW